MARDRFGGRRPPRGNRTIGVAVAAAVALITAWVLAVALVGGGEDTTTAARGAPGTTSAQATPPATTVEQAPRQADPPVQAEPVSRSRGEAGHEGTTPKEGAAKEPAGYDPLETGAKPGDLTETDKGRVEAAARNFVTSAYGYTGHDDSEYATQLNRFIFPWSFYASPGAKYVKEYRKRIRTGGTRSTVTLKRFELGEQSEKAVTGVAHFDVEDPSGARRMRQELKLEPFEPVWRVKSAGELETEAP